MNQVLTVADCVFKIKSVKAAAAKIRCGSVLCSGCLPLLLNDSYQVHLVFEQVLKRSTAAQLLVVVNPQPASTVEDETTQRWSGMWYFYIFHIYIYVFIQNNSEFIFHSTANKLLRLFRPEKLSFSLVQTVGPLYKIVPLLYQLYSSVPRPEVVLLHAAQAE